MVYFSEIYFIFNYVYVHGGYMCVGACGGWKRVSDLRAGVTDYELHDTGAGSGTLASGRAGRLLTSEHLSSFCGI